MGQVMEGLQRRAASEETSVSLGRKVGRFSHTFTDYMLKAGPEFRA